MCLALAAASLAVSGCFTPMQELNWLEQRVARQRTPRPSPLQVAVDTPRPAPVN